MTENTEPQADIYTDLTIDFHDSEPLHHVFTHGKVHYGHVDGRTYEVSDNTEVVIIPLVGVKSIALSEYDPATRSDAPQSDIL